jgi:hypothetical protein
VTRFRDLNRNKHKLVEGKWSVVSALKQQSHVAIMFATALFFFFFLRAAFGSMPEWAAIRFVATVRPVHWQILNDNSQRGRYFNASIWKMMPDIPPSVSFPS